MNTRRPTLILSFTLLVVMLGYGMVLPVIPFYIAQLGAGGRELGWLMASYALMQLLCAPLWGMLSDRIGRKPVLSIGVMGYALSMLLFGLANSFWMLFVARSLSGVLSSATMPSAMAFIGDSAPEKERSAAMGQLGAAAGIGVVVGPLVGGLLSTDSLALPFFVGAGMAFIAFLLVIGILPETHVALFATAQEVNLSREALRQSILSPAGTLLLLSLLISVGLAGFQGMMGLYVADKFAFGTQQVGTIWMVMGGVLILVQGGLTKPLTKQFGEFRLMVAGLAGGALGFVGLSLAVDEPTALLAVGLLSVALALIDPALSSSISSIGGAHQGTLMGLNSASASLGKVIGPLWAGYLYEVNIEYPYRSGAATFLLGLVVCIAGLRPAGRGDQARPPASGQVLP
ncbi:MAG: hypothetical protein RLZZ387_4607 [Chloroflexota bacterium]|jgi:DHA1 family multidrug resistance protein-like MFS transporter